MATITKLHRSTGTVYKARVRRDNAPELSKCFKNRSDAVKWARACEVEQQRDDAGLTTEAHRHTLSAAITKYRAEFLPKLRPETARKYAQHLDYWQPHLGHLRLSELTAAKIAEHRDLLAVPRSRARPSLPRKQGRPAIEALQPSTGTWQPLARC